MKSGPKHLALIFFFVLPGFQHSSLAGPVSTALHSLENYVVDTPKMLSSGLPTEEHLATLKALDVALVMDLIPNNAAREQSVVEGLGMEYHNIDVDWHNPTMANFLAYVQIVGKTLEEDKKVLTHCQLNWRSAVFTYLYKVHELGVPKKAARKAMLNIWRPNEIWQGFINDVEALYAE